MLLLSFAWPGFGLGLKNVTREKSEQNVQKHCKSLKSNENAIAIQTFPVWYFYYEVNSGKKCLGISGIWL